MNAKEARSITKKYYDDLPKHVYERIKKTAGNGFSSAAFRLNTPQYLLKILILQGYKIEHKENLVMVSW